MKSYFSKLETDSQTKKRLRALLPALIADQAALAMLGVVNTFLLSRADMISVSGAAQADAFCTILSTAFHALCIGSSVLVSRQRGEGNSRRITAIVTQTTVYSTLFIAAACFILFLFRGTFLRLLFPASPADILSASEEYFRWALPSCISGFLIAQTSGLFRAADDAKTPLVISLIVNICNLVFGLVLITGVFFGLRLGAEGAGISLFCAKLTGAVLSVILLLRTRLPVRLVIRRRELISLYEFRQALPVGASASLEALVFYTGRLVIQSAIAKLGAATINANQIVLSVHTFGTIVPTAIALATYPVIGYQYGQKEMEMCRNNENYLGRLCMLACWGFAAVLMVFAEQIAGMYSSDPAVLRETGTALRMEALALLLWSQAAVPPIALRCSGIVFFTFFGNSLPIWLVQIPFILLAVIPLRLGAAGVWAGFALSTFVRAMVYRVYKSRGRWLTGE